jgi:uncharacterized protein YdcH (DUF465 family)
MGLRMSTSAVLGASPQPVRIPQFHAADKGQSPCVARGVSTAPKKRSLTGLGGRLRLRGPVAVLQATVDCRSPGERSEVLMAKMGTDISGLIDELRKEHEELDGKLVRIEERPHLSSSEELEVRRLKKLKLSKKDRIYALSQAKSARA